MAQKIKCDYGCGQEAKYQLKNGKWCCSKNVSQCKIIKQKISDLRKGALNPMYGKKMTTEDKNKRSKLMKKLRKDPNSSYNTEEFIEKQKISHKKRCNDKEWKQKASKWMKKAWADKKIGDTDWIIKQKESQKLTITKIKNKYPLFSKIEEMRYNPNKPGEKEIQVHCKNHNCPNSKEQGGWFTPTYIQLYERIRQLEKDYGNGGCYFYCCDECKQECPLYNLKGDPLKDIENWYNQEEYQTFRDHVLTRDNYICQYCGELAEHVHHERPQKLEPFFSLDPDYAISVCKKCHYKYCHKDECSTGNIANKICKEE